MISFFTLAVLIVVSGLVFCLLQRAIGDDPRIHSRVVALTERRSDPQRSRPSTSLDRRSAVFATWLTRHLTPNSDARRRQFQSRLLHSGVYTVSGMRLFLLTRFVLIVVPPVVVLALGVSHFVGADYAVAIAGVAACIGGVSPGLWLDYRKSSRHTSFRQSLPDFFDLLVACMEGGHSLQGALATVADELRVAHPTLATEMSIVRREVELGGTIDVAFRNLSDRTGMDGLKTLSTFVQQAVRMGTSLADTLRTLSDTMRTQREQLAEEMAQKASVKILIPTLLLIFPAIFVIIAGPAIIQLHENLFQ